MAENFIQRFVSLLSGTQVPPLYSLWTAIAGVSALLGRRVKVSLGFLDVYPNICVVLAAQTGQGKSTPIVLMEDLIRKLPVELQPNLVPNEATAPMLVQAMNRPTPQTLLDTGCAGFGLFSELSTFLGKTSFDTMLPDLLINLIDCKTHDKGTIIRGIEKVVNPCFGFIGGTTIETIRTAIPEGAIGSGLAGRFIFAHVEGRGKGVPFPPAIPLETMLEEAIRLAQVSGEMIISEQAFVAHTMEFNRFFSKSPFWENPNLAGYARRRDKYIFKLATIFALANNSMTIYLGHYEAALSLLYKSEDIMQRVMQKITSTVEGSKAALIVELISRSVHISRTDLLRQVIHMTNSRELGEILVSLRDSGQIELISTNKVDAYYKIRGT